MLGPVCLILGLLFALVGRVMLASAAFGISIWWGFGVFLPFGPMFFRLSYPDQARNSQLCRLIALPLLAYAIISGPINLSSLRLDNESVVQPKSKSFFGFALERHNKKKSDKNWTAAAEPKEPTLEERRAANVKEFERLRAWNEALRLQKRDLLRSDVAGNENYIVELAQYNAAFEKATAERKALWPTIKQ